MGYISVWWYVTNPQTTTLNGALGDNAYGTGGSGTSITLTSVTGFPTTGTNYIQVGTEEISYTGVSGLNLTGITELLEEQQELLILMEQQLLIPVTMLHGVRLHLQLIKLLNLVYGPWII